MNNLVVKLDVTNTGDEKFMPVGPCDFECYLDLGETLKKVDNPWVKQQSRIVITKLPVLVLMAGSSSRLTATTAQVLTRSIS
jgi:hypothetical protein